MIGASTCSDAPHAVRSLPTRLGTIRIDERGAGPPLVLLPANGRAAADFDAVRDALAAKHRTLALDWPAMGASPAPAPSVEVSAPACAGALEDVLDGLGLERAILVGHSLGGFAAASVAARQPRRVRALVLIDSGGLARLGLLARVFCRLRGGVAITRAIEARFARFHTRVHSAAMREVIARVEASRRAPGYAEAVGAVWRSFAEPSADLRARLGAIEAPALLVWGAHDPVLPLAAARRAERAVPGARLAVLPTGHTPFAEAPEAFLAAVLPFLAELEAT